MIGESASYFKWGDFISHVRYQKDKQYSYSGSHPKQFSLMLLVLILMVLTIKKAQELILASNL